MSLYQCDKCGARENTALSDGGYLARLIAPEELVEKGLDPKGKYCSECFTGTWHGRFPKTIYPLGTMETDREGSLRRVAMKPVSGQPERVCRFCGVRENATETFALCKQHEFVGVPLPAESTEPQPPDDGEVQHVTYGDVRKCIAGDHSECEDFPAANTTTFAPCGVQDHADKAQIVGGGAAENIPLSQTPKEEKC